MLSLVVLTAKLPPVARLARNSWVLGCATGRLFLRSSFSSGAGKGGGREEEDGDDGELHFAG